MLEGMSRDGSEAFELLGGLGYECHPVSEGGNLLPPVDMTDAYFANFVAVPRGEWQGVTQD
jgi:hypothetical protein